MAGNSQLPNAPLSEVGFELRWELQGGKEAPSLTQWDPGFGVLADGFPRKAKGKGFRVERTQTKAWHVIPYSIASRFYRSEDEVFPLWQIGQGIFAANESVQYDWGAYKKLVLRGVSLVLDSYPVLRSYPFKPNLLELRYIDVFDKELVGTTDPFEFARKATTFEIDKPSFFTKDRVAGVKSARFVSQFSVKGMKGTEFRLDYSSGTQGGSAIVRLESKIVSMGASVPSARSRATFFKKLNGWLEMAHDLTSPFFREFVRPEVMEKFQEKV